MDARIEKVFRDVFADRSLAVKGDLSAANYPAWDSLAQLNLMIGLEEEFGMKFDMDECVSLHTAGEIEDALRAKGIPLDE